MDSTVQVIQRAIYCDDNDLLYYDEACLNVKNVFVNSELDVYKKLQLCHDCHYEFWFMLPPQSNRSLLVPISAPLSFWYSEKASSLESCRVTYQFEQHGFYKYVADYSCDSIHNVRPPTSPYTPFLICLVLILTAWVIYMLFRHLKVKKLLFHLRQRFGKKGDKEADVLSLKNLPPVTREGEQRFRKVVYNEVTDTEHEVEYVTRGMNTMSSSEDNDFSPPFEPKPLEFVEFESLLALRGLVVSALVYLDAEGHTYSFFRESPWDGLKLPDIPLGWLYWVLAASFYLHLSYSLGSGGQSRKRLWFYAVLLRSILYFLGGFFYNNINHTSPRNPDVYTSLNQTRVLGILQRVGLAHLILSSLEVCFMKKLVRRDQVLQDLQDTWPQWLGVLSLLVLHSCITFLLPLPNCPTGYLGAGGELSNYTRCTGGAAGIIDRFFFGDKRLLHNFEKYEVVYKLKVPFEPEGLLGTLTTCVLMALAMQATRIFVYFTNPLDRIIRLAVWSICQLLLGGLLCGFKQYDGLVPINAHLMSASYVLVVSGLATLTLLLFFLLINYWPIWSGFPLIYTGINIILVFVGSELFKNILPFRWLIGSNHMETHTHFLVRAFWCVFVWTYLCYYLLKQRIVCPV